MDVVLESIFSAHQTTKQAIRLSAAGFRRPRHSSTPRQIRHPCHVGSFPCRSQAQNHPRNLVPPHAQAPRVPERTLPDLDMQDKGDLSSTKAPRANKRKDIRSTNANELNKYVSIYVHVHTYTCIRCTLWSNTFGSSSTEQHPAASR